MSHNRLIIIGIFVLMIKYEHFNDLNNLPILY